MIKNKKKKDIKSDNGPSEQITTDNFNTDKNGENQTVDKEKYKEENEPEKDAKDVEIEKLTKNLAELNDKYLRLFSEFDNFRKRTLKEKADIISYANTGLLQELLPVADDFERAIKSSFESSDLKAVTDGISLIQQKFNNILKNKGVEEIKTAGEKFHTDFHEAITTIPANDESQKGFIVEELQKGYLLNGKVIRYARVVVAG